MERRIKLYCLTGLGEVVAFPSSDNQIEIGDFKYSAKRMGGAPTITATVMHPRCLDTEWNENVFAEFNGERYYIMSTPSSSYSNENEQYKHELNLVSERVILDNVYFYDTVVANLPDDDKPASNSTKVVFAGKISDFIKRLNSSLVYTGLQTVDADGEYVSGYRAIIDTDGNGDPITSEDKFLSFENAFFSAVLQEIYKTYDLPYYFKGKEIHIGFAQEDSVPVETFQYGVDDALLSVKKQNANFKIVNRATGKGSSDNIPYYYPNLSPKGFLDAESSNEETHVTILDMEAYSYAIDLDSSIEYVDDFDKPFQETIIDRKQTSRAYPQFDEVTYNVEFKTPHSANYILDFTLSANVPAYGHPEYWGVTWVQIHVYKGGTEEFEYEFENETRGDKRFSVETFLVQGRHDILIQYGIDYRGSASGSHTLLLLKNGSGPHGWAYKGKEVKLREIGLSIDGHPVVGDTITQRLIKRVTTSDALLPSIYRGTDGKQRFYNAVNENYTDEGYLVDLGGTTFPNPYNGHNPKEHIVEVSDIKPTIKGATYNGMAIDKFLEIAYDEDDNNETYEDENGNTNYKHPYFFAKLPAMGFNLFDHAIEQQPMVISFTSGQCASCEFEVAVTEDDDEGKQYNLVQVDEHGDLLRDAETGRVICGVTDFQTPVTPQEEQNDTTLHPVWIALRKEEQTFGHIMPLAPQMEGESVIAVGYRPTSVKDETEDTSGKVVADTFVILGIKLPLQYILDAEKKLEDEVIKYLRENNEEKFTFSIDFSRIYFAENPLVLTKLNENSRLNIRYDDKIYTLYVSSFSYNMSQSDVLPQIVVDLDDELTISQNALQNAISEVKSDVGKALGAIDVLGLSTPYFLRKDSDDEASGKINFKKGVKFGENGKVEILDNNSAKLTIDYLEVTKKATFTSLEIQERTHVGGQLLVTPASINCGEVEEVTITYNGQEHECYRCFFQTKGESGDEIYNQFAVGDQAISQTFNAWGSRYYWRLVVGIGADYIDLSKSICDEGSIAPMAGDKIIQLGNINDTGRQNAIVLAAHGDGSPYFVQYQGIDSFDIPESKVVTKLSPNGNLITGTVRFEAGSTGIENIQGIHELGGGNLLRNSGFTGDYLSKQLESSVSLSGGAELFSPPLDHWETEDVTVIDLPSSLSGKGVLLGSAGSLSQEISFNIIANEQYVLSFKAKGTSGIHVNFGGDTTTVEISDTWNRYIVPLTPTTGQTFTVSSSGAEICEIQLEKGSVASAWKNSAKDNSSELAYWQTTQVVSGAIKDASTTISGGLVLTNTIMVGNYDPETKDMTNVTGGISGYYNEDSDVAFWAGGDYWKALYGAQFYKNSPTRATTAEELENMAKFIVTHGGRAILNDIVLRGTVYAEAGEFRGTVYAEDGKFTGEVEATSGKFNGELRATSVWLKTATPNTGLPIDGAFIDIDEYASYMTANYMLPQLENGEVLIVEAASFYPVVSNVFFPHVQNGNNSYVRLHAYDSEVGSFVTGNDFALRTQSLYKLVGIGKSAVLTDWIIYQTMNFQ